MKVLCIIHHYTLYLPMDIFCFNTLQENIKIKCHDREMTTGQTRYYKEVKIIQVLRETASSFLHTDCLRF